MPYSFHWQSMTFQEKGTKKITGMAKLMFTNKKTNILFKNIFLK